jgi:hypothetical protein
MTNPRGSVHVTVVGPSGSAAVGATVVFVDPDGAVVKTAATDSGGKADAEVLPGASVTTVIRSFATVQMRTTLAIEPGDDLVIGPKASDMHTLGQFTLSWPDAPNHATTFSVYGPCGFAGTTTYDPTGPSPTAPTSLTFDVRNGCETNSAEFVVWARGHDGISLQFNDSTNIPFEVGNSFSTSSAWDRQGFNASFTNVSSISTITADRIVPDGGLSMPVTMAASNPTVIGFASSRGATARVMSTFNAISGATQTVRQKIPGDSTTYSVDVAGTLLAWLDTPTFSAATQEFQLVKAAASAGGSVDPDLLRIEASWQRPSVHYSWEVFGPDTNTVTLPNLPAALDAELKPTAADMVHVSAISYEADTIPNYDSARANIGAAINDTFEAPRSPAALIRVSKSPSLPPPPNAE